jgi:kumamolisin
VTVRVRSAGDPTALARKAYELASTPKAGRKYLTYEELEGQYGATQEELDKIEHFAQEHDLSVMHRSAAERSVVLKRSGARKRKTDQPPGSR